MEMIDLRSDTVTHPTPEMRAAMANAKVGDDVYGEDPTVNRLQEIAAEKLGKEAGIFVASGTMGNLAAILAHCGRGDEVIMGKSSHTFLHEAGGISALGGVHSCQIANQPDGTLSLADITNAIREDDPHEPVTRLVTIENTQNACGGVPISVSYTRSVAGLCASNNLSLHIDGARLFNAAVVLGIDARELVGLADSVTICLSKGLCAPVGSVLCGSREFVARAHRVRKQLGGGMRQAGILAAAGIISLEKMVDRLEEDHTRARRLAEGLSTIPGIVLDNGTPYTNMVFLSIERGSAIEVAKQLAQRNIWVGPIGSRRFRLVTHYWIDDEAVERTVDAMRQVLAGI